ncbi:hypothetical protein K4L44_09505 [Halosquirtibacter laminarini]|uniref:Uncharacterized protein n=1 Tax=Halosquirtibacter laminarini TaxID=3374600 RepID=A0AC61NBM5_9BACT|nr:hypothetical protein K4L44_09505 [Prolixibacteraceae bacterium]
MYRNLTRILMLVAIFFSISLVETVMAQDAQSTPAPAPVVSETPTLVLESGTVIPIKLTSNLIASSSKPGDKFSGVVSMDIIAKDGSVLPQNSKVQGEIVSAKKGGRLAGSAEMVLKLNFVQYEKKYHPIVSMGLKINTEGAGKETIRKAGAGAAIGAAFNGGKGAGRGAAVMGGLQLLSHNGDMRIPAGYVLNFTLGQELKF